jgi:hypothetical protein
MRATEPAMTDELRALNARFIDNFITNDVPSHDAILHEGFICSIQAEITPVAPANYPSDGTIVRKYVKGRAQA